MNALIQCEQFETVPEDDPLLVPEIKIEPKDIKNEINIDIEECNDSPEHHDVKLEIELSPHYVASLETISEEEERLDKLLEEFETKSLNELKNTEQDGTSSTDFEEDKSYSDASDNENVKGYTCTVCKNLFFECDHKLCIPNGKNTICNLCKESNSTNDAHVEGRHVLTEEKPFICNICKKSFCKQYYLTRHNRVHTKEKPFTCNICSKSFSQKYYLIAHIRLHTNEKRHVCDVCGKSFSQKFYLSAHTSSHTEERPFMCNICSKSFTRKSILVEHTRTHTNEKPFACNMCDKSFSQKSNLFVHKRTHTKDKPYMCNICKKSFSQKSNLRRHMRSHLG